MNKREIEPSKRLNECVLNWVSKLAAHFNVAMDDDQVKIFTHALRNNTTYQADIAFDRCLNECEFMPKLHDVHERMPEQRWAPENPAAFVLNGRPVIDLVREIARELFPNLDQMQNEELRDAFFVANRVRYERMGVDCSKWGKQKTP